MRAMTSPRLIEDVLPQWVKKYIEGTDCPTIAREYGVHTSTVYRRLKEQRVRIRTRSEVKVGILNPQWNGDNVGYTSLHEWVKRYLPKSPTCQDCGGAKPLDLANISQKYYRDLTDWEWLCRKCHMSKDGRLTRMYHGGAKAIYKHCVFCDSQIHGLAMCAKHYQQFDKHGVVQL